MTEPETKRGAATTPHDDEEQASSFRVIDRRRFAPDGSDREEAEAATPPEPAAGAERAGEAAPPGSGAPASAPSASGAAAAGEARSSEFVMSEAPPRSDALPEATLSALILSLSTQALMHLGEIPDVAGGQAGRDLPAARSIIDLIAVLQRKTEGNLEAEEAALLERILYDLRMRFVAISRA